MSDPNNNTTLESVQDGDTFSVLWSPTHKIKTRFRLADIDAPERDEEWYKDAKHELNVLLASGTIKVEPHPHVGWSTDPYNRIPAYVWVNELFIQAHMIRVGLAAPWIIHRPCDYEKIYGEALAHAQKLRLGIWTGNTHRLQNVYTQKRSPTR